MSLDDLVAVSSRISSIVCFASQPIGQFRLTEIQVNNETDTLDITFEIPGKIAHLSIKINEYLGWSDDELARRIFALPVASIDSLDWSDDGGDTRGSA